MDAYTQRNYHITYNVPFSSLVGDNICSYFAFAIQDAEEKNPVEISERNANTGMKSANYAIQVPEDYRLSTQVTTSRAMNLSDESIIPSFRLHLLQKTAQTSVQV
jgi:hypothetical protein